MAQRSLILVDHRPRTLEALVCYRAPNGPDQRTLAPSPDSGGHQLARLGLGGQQSDQVMAAINVSQNLRGSPGLYERQRFANRFTRQTGQTHLAFAVY
jgi:hypothetical protein